MTFGHALLQYTGTSIAARDIDLPQSGLCRALLSEIATALALLAERGETRVIDLRSLPLSPPELEDLDVVLDTGEVSATLSVGGVSTVWETRFAGVWRVRHHDGFNEIVADEIHITRIPDVLVAQDEDIAFSAARLAAVSGADATACETSRSEEDVSRG